VVFQESLLFNVSVLDNATAGLRFQGMARKEAESVARAWLSRFGVAHLERRQGRGLSGGEASRVALARAFATAPSLLLLDEPFSSLDAPTRATLVPELRQHLQITGTAAVLVSHDLEEAFAFTDRLAVMEHGRLLAAGNAAVLLARPPSQRVAELLAVDNILPATVVESLPLRRLALTLASGHRLIAHHTSDLEFRCGDDVVVTFPASAGIILSPGALAPDGWNVLTGTIVARTPQRHGWLLSIASPMIVKVLAGWEHVDREWRAGDSVDIAFPPDAVAALPV
jgi:ABC-type sulfate/molybdate transport systems ATPase subunit